jgi:hypothetical protein
MRRTGKTMRLAPQKASVASRFDTIAALFFTKERHMTERKSSTKRPIVKRLKGAERNETGQGPGGGHIIKVIKQLLNALHQKAEQALAKILQTLPK